MRTIILHSISLLKKVNKAKMNRKYELEHNYYVHYYVLFSVINVINMFARINILKDTNFFIDIKSD